MRIVGYSISEVGVTNTDCEVPQGTLLEYLVTPKKNAIRLLYHLEFNVASLLRQLRISKTQGEELLYTTKLTLYPYKLRYIPGKLFSVKDEGVFSYFGDANQYIHYPCSELLSSPDLLADRAKSIGEKAYKILLELGVEPTNLVNPARGYEELEVSTLEKVRELLLEWESSKEDLEKIVIQGLIHRVTRRKLWTDSNGSIPITLDRAIKRHQWGKLGKLLEVSK